MLDKIKVLAENRSGSKASIASFVLEHLDEIESITLDDLAKESYTSKASLVRFAQALGYKGWTDFLPALIAERYYHQVHYSNIDHSLPFTDQDDTASIIQKIATIEKESIQDTADRLNGKDLEEAAELLQNARRVVVFGLTPNEYLAHIFKRKMLSIGKVIEVAQSGEFGLTAASLTEKDLAIIISYSGNSLQTELSNYLTILHKNKVKRIGLTSENGLELKKVSQICFIICTRESKYKKIGNFSTEESILFILNSLYAVYFKKDYFANYVRKVNLAADLEDKAEQ